MANKEFSVKTEKLADDEFAELLGDLRLLKNWNPTQDRREEMLDKAIAHLRAQDGEPKMVMLLSSYERVAQDHVAEIEVYGPGHEWFKRWEDGDRRYVAFYDHPPASAQDGESGAHDWDDTLAMTPPEQVHPEKPKKHLLEIDGRFISSGLNPKP